MSERLFQATVTRILGWQTWRGDFPAAWEVHRFVVEIDQKYGDGNFFRVQLPEQIDVRVGDRIEFTCHVGGSVLMPEFAQVAT